MKRKRDNASPAEDHHESKRFKQDEEGKEEGFSSTSAVESGNVCEISERSAKPGTSLATKLKDKFDKCEEGQGDTANEGGEMCESDPEIQIESLESSSEEEGPKIVRVSKVTKEAVEEKHLKKAPNEEEDVEDEISNKGRLSQDEENAEDKIHNKHSVLLEQVEDFEVVLNEDYSNGSTGSSLVNYNISGTNKDSACDSTVLDESDIILGNVEKVDVENSDHTLANKRHFNLEKVSEESSNRGDEKVSKKSNESSAIDKEEDDKSESAMDKYPDSTTTEPTEKIQSKVPITPSKYKDVFQKLKTTANKVKSLPVSPKHAVYSPDSSSKVESGSNVESHNIEAMDIEEDIHPLQGKDIKKDEKDDCIASKTENQAKLTGLHKLEKSKCSLSLKCKKKDQQTKDTLHNKDSCDSEETNQEKYIVISSSQDTDEDVSEKPQCARKLTDDFFENCSESPLKIIHVASGTAIEAMDSGEEQEKEMEVDSVSRGEEQKNVTQDESKTSDVIQEESKTNDVTQEESKTNDVTQEESEISDVTHEDNKTISQKKLEKSNSREETKEEGTKPDIKCTDDEPSTSAEGGAKREKKGSKRQIERLEKLLKDIRDKIEALKETEVDLDDEDSAYIMEEKYQKKFVKVWNKLCEIKESSTDTGRPVERKFRYEGTRYPEINKKIEKFVNKTKCFPDYHDVKEIIISVNKSKSLRIKTSAIDRLAREAFADVGDQLQKRREQDFQYTFLGHLPPEKKVVRNEDDPAYDDKALQLKLEENKKISKSRLNEVLEKYVQKQERRDEGEDDEDDTQEEEEDTQGDEEEEDNEDVDVPEMDQIINGESQDGTLDSSIISEESRELSLPSIRSEMKKEKPETGKQERYSEANVKEVWEPVTVKDEVKKEKIDTMNAFPVVLKPVDDDIVCIDDDDDDVMVAQEDLLDFSHKRTKQNTKHEAKPDEIKEKKSGEVPNIIQSLHKEIMNQFYSIKSSINKGETLSSSTVKPEVYTGKNFVERKFPSYQVKNNSGVSYTASSKVLSKTNQNRASLSRTNDSRASCSGSSDKRKGGEINDLKFVHSKKLHSLLVSNTEKNQRELQDKEIKFIPLNKMGEKLLGESVNPERGNQRLDVPHTSEEKTKSDPEEVVIYPSAGQKIVNVGGRHPQMFKKGHSKPCKNVKSRKSAPWNHMEGTTPVLLDISDESSAEDEPVFSSHTEPVQTSSSSAQGISASLGRVLQWTNSSEKGNKLGQSSRLSHVGGERKHVPSNAVVKVLKQEEDDDIIILD
ncbi:neurofilament medium polypeptide-like isoform X2 [Saccostrea cucullata]